MVHYVHIWWGRTSMIELVRDLRVINVLAKFEYDPWKSMDVRVLTGLVCPAARPLGVNDNTPEPLRADAKRGEFFKWRLRENYTTFWLDVSVRFFSLLTYGHWRIVRFCYVCCILGKTSEKFYFVTRNLPACYSQAIPCVRTRELCYS